MSEQKQNNRKESGLWDVVVTSLLILALLGIVALLYWGGLKFRAEIYHSQAVRAMSQGNVNRAQRSEGKAVNLASFEDRYYRGLSQIYLSKISRTMGNNKLSRKQKRNRLQQLVGRANFYSGHATQLSGRNVVNWTNRGFINYSLMNYGVQGADEQAIKSYNRALELNPNNPQIYVRLARIYTTKAGLASQAKQPKKKEKFFRKAERKLKKALEIKPNYSEALFQLGIVYWRNEKLDKAKNKFEKVVKLSPNSANARYFLGVVYDRVDKKQKAIEQFEKIASLNKENKKQVQDILKNLKAGRPALGKRSQLPTKPEEVPNLEQATSTNATTTQE